MTIIGIWLWLLYSLQRLFVSLTIKKYPDYKRWILMANDRYSMLINTVIVAFYLIFPFVIISLYLGVRRKPLTRMMSLLALICVLYSLFMSSAAFIQLARNIDTLPDTNQSLFHIIHQLLLLVFSGLGLYRLIQKKTIAYYWISWVFILSALSIKLPQLYFYAEKTPSLYLSYSTTSFEVLLNIFAVFGLLYIRYYYSLLVADESSQFNAYRKRNTFYPIALMSFLISVVLHAFVVKSTLDSSVQFGYFFW